MSQECTKHPTGVADCDVAGGSSQHSVRMQKQPEKIPRWGLTGRADWSTLAMRNPFAALSRASDGRL